MTVQEQAERSIVKKYRKEIWYPFIKSLKRYELIKAGDKVAACISGGKDSMLMAKLLQELQRHNQVPFRLVFLVMNPGYSAENLERVLANAELLGIPVTVFNSDIYDTVAGLDGSPCYLCARMRRGHLYKNAQELGCNKIALGHHLNDVIETTVMGMFYGAQIQAMLPKLHSDNFAGMQLIRPMYHVRERYILAWQNYNGLEFIRCACRFTERCAPGGENDGSKRAEVKELLKALAKDDPAIESRIFTSIHNVKLDTLPGYKQGGVQRSFLDGYED